MSAIILPATMDKVSLPPLAREMAALCDKGEAMLVDGSKVSRVGLAGLQLLVSAAREAKDRSVEFKLMQASDELAGAVSLSGLDTLLGLAA